MRAPALLIIFLCCSLFIGGCRPPVFSTLQLCTIIIQLYSLYYTAAIYYYTIVYNYTFRVWRSSAPWPVARPLLSRTMGAPPSTMLRSDQWLLNRAQVHTWCPHRGTSCTHVHCTQFPYSVIDVHKY